MKVYVAETKELRELPFSRNGLRIIIAKPNKGIYEAVENSPVGFKPFSWKIQEDKAIPSQYAPNDWEELGYGIRVKAHEYLLSLPDFDGVSFQDMFDRWLRKIKLPSRNLPLTTGNEDKVNLVYLRVFDPEEEEQQLRALAAYGWALIDDSLVTGFATDEGLSPIFGTIEKGCLLEIEKIEDLQP